MTGPGGAGGAPCPIQGYITYAKGPRGMFDHLQVAHHHDAGDANETVAALAGPAGWGSVTTFVPRRPRRDADAQGSRTTAKEAPGIKPRPSPPPQEAWEELVDYLIEIVHVIHKDRHIPKYQFERHVDSLLVPFLPEILAYGLGGVFQVVASEFPLKKLDNNQSTNADALLHQSGPEDQAGTWWLFELKTDPGRSAQHSSSRMHVRASGACRTLSTISRRWQGQAAPRRSTRSCATSSPQLAHRSTRPSGSSTSRPTRCLSSSGSPASSPSCSTTCST